MGEDIRVRQVVVVVCDGDWSPVFLRAPGERRDHMFSESSSSGVRNSHRDNPDSSP